MSTGFRIPDHIRSAAVRDYHASGEPLATVAARHGVSKTALASWVKPGASKTRVREWTEEEVALTGGRWVGVGGIQRWEAFEPIRNDDLTEHQKRVQAEEAMFTEDEARDAHARYAYGHRDDRTVVGERVYQRRKKRAQTARKASQEEAA